MALPELYRYGREGYWFNMRLFLAYMLDGVVQVRHKTHHLPTFPTLIAFTVGAHLLRHPVHLRGAHFPGGWLRREPIRVFHCHGHRRCPDSQSFQRVEHQRLDRLGVLRCSPRQCPALELYCK